MFLTGELSARLSAYSIIPRVEPPINRAPIARVLAHSTAAEARERASIAFTSGWVHPVVYGKVSVAILEAQGLIASTYTYDPIQQLLVRGSEPTVGYPNGTSVMCRDCI